MWGGRNLRSATLAVVGALALVAIAVSVESGGDPVFQADVARGLAGRSDDVAASLSRGDRCAADRDADELRADSVLAARRNLVSPEMARELLVRTRRLAKSISCPPPTAARPTPQTSAKTSPTPAPMLQPQPRNAPLPRAAGHGKKTKDDRGEHGRGKKHGRHHGGEE